VYNSESGQRHERPLHTRELKPHGSIRVAVSPSGETVWFDGFEHWLRVGGAFTIGLLCLGLAVVMLGALLS
jgi:hypothetical protein